jgi:hypothetical protein
MQNIFYTSQNLYVTKIILQNLNVTKLHGKGF